MNTIADLKSLRASKIARANEIAKELGDEAEGEFGKLKSDIESLNARIASLEEMNAIKAEDAEYAEVESDEDEKAFTASAKKININRGAPQRKEAPGTKAARFLIGAAIASKGNHKAAVDFVKNNFNDAEVAKELNYSDSSAGGYTIPQVFIPELVEALNSKTVVRKMGAKVWPMPQGNMRMPAQATTSAATWIGEGNNIVSSDFTFSEITWSAKKLAAIIPVTNDLLRRSPLALESYVRTEMIKRISLAEDKAFLTGTGGAYSPTGLTGLVHNDNKLTTVSTAYADVLQDLRAAELALTGKNVDTGSAGWVMHPAVKSFLASLVNGFGVSPFADELARGTLLGYPVFDTANLPTNLTGTVSNVAQTGGTYVFFANADDLVIGDTLNIVADSTSEASADLGAGVVSAYQRDMTFFRTILEMDFNILYPYSASVLTTYNWLPTAYTPAAASDAFTR